MATADSSTPTPARRPWVWWAVAAVVVIVAVVAVALAARGGSAPNPGAGGSSSSGSPAAGPAGSSPASSTSPSGSVSARPSSTPSSSAPSKPARTSKPSKPTTRPTKKPVDIDEDAHPEKGVVARLTTIEPVTGVTTFPGEVGGPSLRVTVEIENGTSEALDLTGAVVNLYTGEDMVPTVPLVEPGQRLFPSSVDAGKTASGRFVFNVPTAERDNVVVEVDLALDTPVVLFRGAAPKG